MQVEKAKHKTDSVVRSGEQGRKNFLNVLLKRFSEQPSEDLESSEPKTEETSGAKTEETSGAKIEESSEATRPPKILMVRTENLVHEPFQQTKELKVSYMHLILSYQLWDIRFSVISYVIWDSFLAENNANIYSFRPYQRK